MAYNGKPFFKIPRPVLLAGGVENRTIDGNIDLADKDSLFQMIDGQAADRDVTLPAEQNGRVYCIQNAGTTNNLVVKDVAASTIVTIAAGNVAVLVCDDTAWYPIINVSNL